MSVHACAERDEPQANPRVRALVAAEVIRVLEVEDKETSVIINFREPAGDAQQRVVYGRHAQRRLEQRAIEGLTITHRYESVSAVAGRIRQSALEQLRDDPDVESIEVDQEGSGQLRESVPAIGGDQVRSLYGLTGKGVRVAVLDSGLDLSHPDFGGRIIAQRCFARGACAPSRASTGTSAQDDHGHGSNVAGIVGSQGKVAPRGFAPDVEIVAVKVLNSSNAGSESDWVAGFDWVYSNLSTLQVKVINASLGTSQLHPNDGSCDRSHTAMVRAIRNLTEAGVTVFASSGNQGSRTSLSSPACVTGTVAVGAVFDSNVGRSAPFRVCADAQTAFDVVTCFTNSNARLDMVAPGAPILSVGLRGGTRTFHGTSQASPTAAGVAALMLQCNPSLTPAQIKAHLQQTGTKVRDPKNGVTVSSIRALPAVRAACPNLVRDGTL